METTQTPLLEVRDHSVYFRMYDKGFRQRDSQVIRNLSITVNPGEVLAVVGASGSGKSVLAHSILGLLPKNAWTEGAIVFDGKELMQKDKERLRGKEISLIPQSVTYLDPLMKVGDQVLEPKRGDGGRPARRATAAELLSRYDLGQEVLEYYPFQLSGGMTRRVLVSTASSAGARLVVADEPTPGMDQRSVAETVRLFRAFADQGCGVVLITHDIEMGLQTADRVAVFLDGTVVEVASVEDFTGRGEALSHPFSRALWNALPSNGFHSSTKEAAHAIAG